MLVKDGINYRFVHRSFQEYFAAWYTCKLTENERYQLITAWIKETKPEPENLYLEMLYGLQPDDTNRVVLLPGVKQLKELYNNLGFSIKFLNEVFNGIVINYDYNKMCNHMVPLRMLLRIKNFYLFDVVKIVCVLNRFVFQDLDSDLEKEVLIKLAEKFKIDETIEFNIAIKIVGENKLLNALRWFEEQILFAFNIMEKYETSSLANYDSLLSILNRL